MKETNGIEIDLDECPSNETTQEEVEEPVGETEPNNSQPVRKSSRPTRAPDRYYGFS